MSPDAQNRPLGWSALPETMARIFPDLRWESPGTPVVDMSSLRTELENRRSLLSLTAIRYHLLPALARQGWIRPLDPWFDAGDMARYAPQAVALATVDGRLYGIPDDITPFVFFIRRTVLQRLGLPPPRTWEDVEAFAVRLKERERKTFTMVAGGEGLRLGFLLSLLGSNGVPLMGSAYDMVRDPALLSTAYEWVCRLSRKLNVLPTEALTHPRNVGFKSARWRETAAGFAWLSTFWGMSAEAQQRFVFLPFPRGPGLPPGVEPCVPMKGQCWCMPWTKASPEAAVAVLRDLHGPAVRRAIGNVEGFPYYPIRECWDDPAIRRQYPLYECAADLVEGKRAVLGSGEDSFFHRLDVTFRNALLDGLDARGWLDDLTGAQDALPRAGELPPIRWIMSGIESRLARLRGINAIAREMGMRPERLRRIFRRATGGDVGEYLRKRRMDLARGLLAEKQFTVTEVAQRVGYQNVSAFCRAYARYWGHSPAADRRGVQRQLR